MWPQKNALIFHRMKRKLKITLETNNKKIIWLSHDKSKWFSLFVFSSWWQDSKSRNFFVSFSELAEAPISHSIFSPFFFVQRPENSKIVCFSASLFLKKNWLGWKVNFQTMWVTIGSWCWALKKRSYKTPTVLNC